jgi:hypothetical protein
MYSRNNYYELKKHLYQERYLDKKERKKRLDEVYKDYGGEKEYIRDYWVNKRWKLVKTSDELIDENKILTNSNDRSETNESNQS